jgi:hypothetical protein
MLRLVAWKAAFCGVRRAVQTTGSTIFGLDVAAWELYLKPYKVFFASWHRHENFLGEKWLYKT